MFDLKIKLCTCICHYRIDRQSIGTGPCYQSKRIITVSDGGRLGNNMGQYATLWYYSKVLKNVEAFISPQMQQNLQKVFPHISLPAFKIAKSCQKQFRLMDGDHDEENIVKYFKRKDNDSMAFVNIRGYPNAVNLYHRFRDDLQCEFRFSERASYNAEAFRDHVHSLYCQKSMHCDRLLLVGVHVRRTDYKYWMTRRAKQGLVDEKFFLSAMELMINKTGILDRNERLIFIVASDDSKWCKEKFSRFKLNYTIMYTLDYYPQVRKNYLDAQNLSSCSKKHCNDAIGLEHVHFDLAVMSSMDDNIFDYGTYGFWGAYLSQSNITIGADLRVTHEQSKFLVKERVVDAAVEGFIFLQPP